VEHPLVAGAGGLAGVQPRLVFFANLEHDSPYIPA
jgi:hypothetical protein